MKCMTGNLYNNLQKQLRHCSSNAYWPEKICLNVSSVYKQGKRDGDGTTTKSWWKHITNNLLQKIIIKKKKLLEIKDNFTLTHFSRTSHISKFHIFHKSLSYNISFAILDRIAMYFKLKHSGIYIMTLSQMNKF